MNLVIYVIDLLGFVLMSSYMLLMIAASAGYIKPRVPYWVVAVMAFIIVYSSFMKLLVIWSQ